MLDKKKREERFAKNSNPDSDAELKF